MQFETKGPAGLQKCRKVGRRQPARLGVAGSQQVKSPCRINPWTSREPRATLSEQRPLSGSAENLAGGTRLLGKTTEDGALCEWVGLEMSSKPLPQKQALSATLHQVRGSRLCQQGGYNTWPLLHSATECQSPTCSPHPSASAHGCQSGARIPRRGAQPPHWLPRSLPARPGTNGKSRGRHASTCQVPSVPDSRPSAPPRHAYFRGEVRRPRWCAQVKHSQCRENP